MTLRHHSSVRQHEVYLFMSVLANQHGYALRHHGRIAGAQAAFPTAHDETDCPGHSAAALRSELGSVLCDRACLLKRKAALEAAIRTERISRHGGYKPQELEALLVGMKRDICRVWRA